MFPLKLFGLAVGLGAFVATPLVWANLPATPPPSMVASDSPALPEPFLGPWVPAGTVKDPVGRALSSGYRWLPDGDMRSTAFTVTERWNRRSLLPSFHATEDGGLFLSAVDLDANHQESFYLQPGAGGLSVWVTVAALPADGERARVQGPVVGGQGQSETRELNRPFNQAAERSAVALKDQGWTVDAMRQSLEKQMRHNGALVRYWTKGDRTLQELVQRTATGSRLQLTHLPRQMDRD